MIANQNADHECVWSVFVVICPDPVLVKAIVLHEEMAWKQHRRFALTCWAAVDQIFGAFGRPVCDEIGVQSQFFLRLSQACLGKRPV